jgi:hypothetical protein
MDHAIRPLSSAQAPFDDNIDSSSTACDPLPAYYSDEPSIESAIDGFMPHYLHDNWGWDPFSVSVSLSDYYGNY